MAIVICHFAGYSLQWSSCGMSVSAFAIVNYALSYKFMATWFFIPWEHNLQKTYECYNVF